MGMIYTAPIPSTNYTNSNGARTIFQINAPSDAVVIIHEVHFGFRTTVSTSETIEFKRVSTTGTGSPVTEVRHELGFVLPGSTVTHNHTVEGTLVDTMFEIDFNVLNGHHHVPVPKARYVLSPSGRLAVGFSNAPINDIIVNGLLVWEELGG